MTEMTMTQAVEMLRGLIPDEDEEPKIRWGDVLREYGYRVFGISL